MPADHATDEAAPHGGPPDPPTAHVLESPAAQDALGRYWRRNVRYMIVLLLIWIVVSLGCGVLFANALNGVKLGGFPLGFWFAQQGSIVVFVLLILVYCVLMNRLDRRHHEELRQLKRGPEA